MLYSKRLIKTTIAIGADGSGRIMMMIAHDDLLAALNHLAARVIAALSLSALYFTVI